MKRILYIVLGCLAVGLGIIGVVLPGFPTTPFLLLASWFFVRSSVRLNAWLHRTRYLGGYLRRFNGEEPQTKWDKIIPLVTTWVGIGFSLCLIGSDNIRILVFCLGWVATFSILFAKRILKGKP
ncbi:MAG: YbaN family protein [Marinifilaceae bacterium]